MNHGTLGSMSHGLWVPTDVTISLHNFSNSLSFHMFNYFQQAFIFGFLTKIQVRRVQIKTH